MLAVTLSCSVFSDRETVRPYGAFSNNVDDGDAIAQTCASSFDDPDHLA